MIKTVLVPVDDSDVAVAAVARAVGVARTAGSDVHLLFAVPDPFLRFLGDSHGDRRRFLEDVARYLKRLASTHTPTITRQTVVNGEPGPAILEYVRDFDCDLVVMATHGRQGVERALLGSVAEEMMRSCPCPVMVVHGHSKHPKAPAAVLADRAHSVPRATFPDPLQQGDDVMRFKRFLVPVDYSEYSRAALKYAAELAHDLQGELIVLHVVEPVVPATPTYVAPMTGYGQLHKEMVDAARHYLDDLKTLTHDVPSRSVVRSGEAGDEIAAAAQEEAADVIVMATHGRSGLSRLLMGSTTEAVLRHASVPVLALRAGVLAPDAATHAVKAPPIL